AAYWAARVTSAVAFGSVLSEFPVAKQESCLWLGSLSARWPRDQIYNSSSAAELCRLARGFFVPKRLSVVRNGLDLEQFRSVPPATGGRVRIVGVGSLVPVKRWDGLVRAAVACRRRG